MKRAYNKSPSLKTNMGGGEFKKFGVNNKQVERGFGIQEMLHINSNARIL